MARRSNPTERTSFHLFVNADAVIEAADYIGGMGARIRPKVIEQANRIVREAIDTVLLRAVTEADREEGFPPEFQAHVLRAAANIRPTIFFDGNEIFIEVDLERDLGGEEALKKAFHQGAVLADGKTKLDGPFVGQALLTEDDDTRHDFWLAIRYGASTYTTFDRRRGKPVTRPIKDAAGKWERTKQKYIEIWGDEAPEWLFIQFGQPEWEPRVPQIDIVGQIQDAVNYAMTEELFYIVSNEVAIANSFQSTGLETGYNKAGRLVVISGHAVVNGKTYGPGTFVPKGGF